MKSLFKWILWLVIGLFLLLAILVGVAFFVFDSDTIKSQAIAAVKEQTTADLAIGDDVSLSIFPWLAIETGKVTLSNPEGFKNKNNLLSVDKLKASVKLKPLLQGQIEVGAVELLGSELNLIRDRKGRSNLDVLMTNAQQTKAAPATVESSSNTTSLSVSQVHLSDFVLNQYAPNGKITQSFSLNEFKLNQFAFDQWTPISAAGDFKSGSGKTEANWDLTSEIKVSADAKNIELKSTKAVMSNISNQLKHLELTGDSQVSLNNKNTKVSHRGTILLDKQNFDMDLKGTFSKVKDLQLTLITQDLDLTPLMGATDSSSGTSSTTPLDTKPIADFLKTARLKGTFKANSVTAGKVNLQNVSADLSNKGATLWLKPFKANAFKGELATSASINFAAKPLALSVAPSLKKIEVGDLIGQMFDVEKLSGLGSLDLNLRTRGTEVKQMLKNLSGNGSVDLSDGALLGLDFNKMIESGLSLQNLTNTNAFKGKTTFAALKGNLAADKGLINLNNLALVTPLFDLTGKAATDANKESLSGNFKLTLKGLLKDQLEKKYPQLAGMDLPFELKGTWAEPKPNIDFESLLKAKYKSQVDKKVEEKKKELKDELKKKLLDKFKFD